MDTVFKQKLTAKLAAVFLTIITLTIFYLNQNKSPESVFRTFNSVLQKANFKKAQDLCLKSKTSSIDYLIKRAQYFALYKTNYAIQQSNQNNEVAMLEILYQFADNSTILTIWSFKKLNSEWKIDSDRTAFIWRNQLGLN